MAQHLGEYIASLYSTGLLEQMGAYAVAMFAGIGTHYTKAWFDGRIEGSIWSYFVTQFPKRTVLMLVAQVGAAAGIGLSGAWDSMSWGALLFNAFTAGYAVDSVMNKSNEPNAATLPESEQK